MDPISMGTPLPHCPGFCGRISFNATNFSSCQACPWGFRASFGASCAECVEPLSEYDWLYLIFVFLLPLLFHAFYVHYYIPSENPAWTELVELCSCVVECVLAAIGSLLIFRPYGSLSLVGCKRDSMKEWYPWMHNPVINYTKTLPCTHELVYPLFSLPFVYLLGCLVNAGIIRSTLYVLLLRKHRSGASFYAALFTIPSLAVANALLAGILYFTFPYTVALFAVGANAVHMSHTRPTTCRAMISVLLRRPQHVSIICINMALFSFSIIAIAIKANALTVGLLFLLAVPVPPIFFAATLGLTHPTSFMKTS